MVSGPISIFIKFKYVSGISDFFLINQDLFLELRFFYPSSFFLGSKTCFCLFCF